jgi:S-adenosylmethionine hydrolase
VAVVDPGVGGARAILAMRARGAVFLAPDNGLLGFVARPEEVEELVRVEERRYFLPRPSDTFHGRDIIAPVAARLALGLSLSRLGPRADGLVRVGTEEARETRSRSGREIRGQIVDIDNFGNCITNIPAGIPPARFRDIRVGRRRFPAPVRSYCAGRIGQPVVIIGSMGYLEISVNRGRADRVLGLRRGQRVSALRI